MDYQSNDYGNGDRQQSGGSGNGYTQRPPFSATPLMAYASLVLAIISIFSLLMGLSFFFSALGIIFALLSRKRAMTTPAKAGLIISVVTLALFIFMIVFCAWILVSTGTWDRIMADLQTIDMSSGNAYSDIMDMVTKELNDLMTQMTNSMGGVSL